MYTYVYTQIYVYILYIYIYAYTNIYIDMYTCIHIYLSTYMHIYIWLCIYKYTYNTKLHNIVLRKIFVQSARTVQLLIQNKYILFFFFLQLLSVCIPNIVCANVHSSWSRKSSYSGGKRHPLEFTATTFSQLEHMRHTKNIHPTQPRIKSFCQLPLLIIISL